jgi:hypothetical protein
MRRWLGTGAAVIAVVVVVAIAVAGTQTRHRADARDAPSAASAPASTAVTGPTVRIQSEAPGPPVHPGFLGFSFEFQAVRAYTGTDPAAINPVLLQLIRNLTPGQAPVIRIGGDSTDVSWVPTRGVSAPPYVSYRLTPSWLATTSALAHELGARMTMGLNLAANEPALAAAEARAFARALGPSTLAATEIGNEPNVYSKIQILHTLLGAPLYARPRGYGYPAFRRELAAEAAAAPGPMWGPALAVGPTPVPGSWVRTIPDFLQRNPRLPVMTVHRYPLRNCFVPPSSPQYPTVGHLLAGYATRGLAASLRPWIAIAHHQRRALRVDELNSVACRGKTGVSDVFASALWVTDALFSLVRARVDGVNLHTLPRSAYQLFTFRHRAGRWDAEVPPVYYGLQLFAQAAPPRSRLLHLTGVATTPGLSVWATRATDGTVRVVLINKSVRADHTVALRPPSGLRAAATIERLTASGVHAARDITLGGRTYGASTTTGRLAPLQATSVTRQGRAFAVSLPHASAALVTIAAR